MNIQEPKQTVLFSIVTCTLNSKKYLKNNIYSVVKQTLKNYEHIFIDGGSEDGTIDIIDSYKKHAGVKVKKFINLERGVSAAFNCGIEKARGKYLIFLNSDDYLYDKNVLKYVANYLKKNPEIDWIYGKINVVEIGGKSVGVFPTNKIFQLASSFILKYVNYIPHQAVFIKKEVFKRYGNFDTLLKVNMDTDLWFRLSRKTNWKYVDRIISNYTVRPDAISSDLRNKNEGDKFLKIVKARYLNRLELFFAKIGDWLIARYNKTYR